MIENIRDSIIIRMKELNLTSYALEKKAGLKRNAVSNIINRNSKNPSASTLQSIARSLDCTLEDLIGYPPVVEDNFYNKIEKIENLDLFNECFQDILLFYKEHNLVPSYHKFIFILKEIYLLSLEQSKKVDKPIIDWIIEKYNK